MVEKFLHCQNLSSTKPRTHIINDILHNVHVLQTFYVSITRETFLI